MNQNSLFEILAIFIGFAGIMLVLSLLVTALTQAIAHFLSIRAKNLEAGLDELLATARGESKDKPQKNPDATAGKGSKDKSEIKLAAKDILESNSLMKQGKISYLPKFMAPKASWVLKEELEMLLHEQSKEYKELTTEVIKKAMSWFSRMERGLSQRFNVIMRCITFGCALLVAVVFQVSTPDVMKRLSTDPQYRAKAEMEAINLVSKYEAGYTALIRYEDVSAKALEQLQNNNPGLQETLEEVSGIGNTKNDILDELSVVLEDNPRRQELVVEYESMLDKLHREGYEQADKMIEESIGTLALFDIAAFSHGAGFYWDIQNLLGILMTTVLISLGAPFWFSTLRRLVALRDVLAPEQDKKGKDKATTNQ